MKVLYVIESLGRGGAEQLLVTLLPEMKRQGVGVFVAVRDHVLDLAPELEAAGISLYLLPPRHRWNILFTARELARLVEQQDIDLVHAHLYFPSVCVACMRILRFSRVSTCVTFHNLAYAGANQPSLGLFFRRYLASFFYPLGFDRYWGVSQAVASHYEKNLNLRKVEVIYNSVDISELRRIAGEVLEKPRGIILPGRIVHEKGHVDLLDALVILSQRGWQPQVTIAGDGPLRTLVETKVDDLHLRDQVRFTGTLHHEALLRAMASATIVVVPSRFEGFGLTALEALGLGRAVVASTAGGLAEVVSDAGLLVPVADPQALAEALETLLSNSSQCAQLGERGVARAFEFNLPIVAARQIEAYQTLLSPHSPVTQETL